MDENPAVDALSYTGPGEAFTPPGPIPRRGLGPPAREPAPAPPVYTFDHDVFVLARPWEGCSRCQAALQARQLVLPEGNEDFVCPHTRRQAYVALRARLLREAIPVVSCREETLRSGVVQVSLSWCTPQDTTLVTAPVRAPKRL